jgi:hypothetical protein
VTCHPRENPTGIEHHPAHVFPTAGRLRRLIVVVVSSRLWRLSTPLPPQGGTLSEQGSGFVIVEREEEKGEGEGQKKRGERERRGGGNPRWK